MTRRVIVTIAPTGGMASKQQNPNLPTQPDEIASDVIACARAGASIAALHARRADDLATCDAAVYRRINSLIRDKSDIIINNSTGGGTSGDMIRELPNGLWEISYEERVKGLDAGAEMATFDAETTVATFDGKEIIVPTSPRICDDLAERFRQKGIKPEWEVFSPEHILQDVTRLIQKGYDKPPYFINMVLGAEKGFQGAMPYSADTLAYMVRLLPPDSVFCVSGIGAAQLPATTQALLMGGHVRVGLEDNNYYSSGRLATNVELVERTMRLMAELQLDAASPAQAREMLNLPMR